MTEATPPTAVGVVGVGSMGENHARVYRHLPGADLVGVCDADRAHAEEVADRYDTRPMGMADLLSAAQAVSVAVPTEYHYEAARECIDAGVDVLVEKPFVADPTNGRRLVEFAGDRGVTLQVGHVERFNPAVRSVVDLVGDLDVIAVDASRLSPPLDRDIDDSAVLDLMIHDLDVLLTLVEGEVTDVGAVGTDDGRYAAATLQFDSGVVGQLTASRVTQQQVRRLAISATDARVTVDYIDQSIEISRQSVPEYVRDDGGVEYRHERVIEEVSVEGGEPLERQLRSFLSRARTGEPPLVTGEDGLRALELAREIERRAVPGQRSQATVAR